LFNRPVTAAEAPDYSNVVCKPMDSGTIERRGRDRLYKSADAFEADVQLVFANATLFNRDTPSHQVHLQAEALRQVFITNWAKAVEADAKQRAQCNGCPMAGSHHCCTVCGYQCMRRKPEVYRCNICSRYIVTKQDLYLAPDASWCCCELCHKKLPCTDVKPLLMEDLQKRNTGSGLFEEMVRCSMCRRYEHCACALYNPRAGSSGETYACCACRMQARHRGRDADAETEAVGVATLQHNVLSAFVEARVRARCTQALDDYARRHGAAAAAALNAGDLSVRVLASGNKIYDVPIIIWHMFRAGPGDDLPPAFDYTVKAIGLCARIDGVDVCVLIVYVYEYGADAPACNRKSVYVAYVDSVEYVYPDAVRSQLYQEVIGAYLEHARRLGFETAYLWSAPARQVGSYVWWQRPARMKAATSEHLRSFYNRIFKRCGEDDTTVESMRTNLYVAHF
ncbi:hypothetical protein JKP88DRAFT_148095, partial [Tribonema minus]